VIRTAHVRSPTMKIDALTQRELDELLATIQPEAKAFAG